MIIETKNALITSTFLGVEDHGIMTFYLNLNYGGEGQGAGGYRLDHEKGEKTHTAKLLLEIMKVCGVNRWEDLTGTHIRVRQDNNKVHAIGNYLKDEWLDFDEFLKKYNAGD